MLMMRLQRIGRKNDPSFRVVVTDSRNGPKAGNHVDLLGSYNPKMNIIQIDGEKAKKWMSQGVQVSDTVFNLLVTQKIIEGKKKNVLPKKSPVVNEEKIKAEAEAKAAKEAKAKEAEEAKQAEKVAAEAVPEVAEGEVPVVAEETPAPKAEVASEVTPEAPAEEAAPEAPVATEAPTEEEKVA